MAAERMGGGIAGAIGKQRGELVPEGLQQP